MGRGGGRRIGDERDSVSGRGEMASYSWAGSGSFERAGDERNKLPGAGERYGRRDSRVQRAVLTPKNAIEPTYNGKKIKTCNRKCVRDINLV